MEKIEQAMRKVSDALASLHGIEGIVSSPVHRNLVASRVEPARDCLIEALTLLQDESRGEPLPEPGIDDAPPTDPFVV